MSITRVDLKKAQEEAARLREENARLKDRLRMKSKPEPEERVVTKTVTKEVPGPERVVYERRPEDAVRIATLEADNDLLRREIEALMDGEE